MQSGILPYDLARMFSGGQGAGKATFERDMGQPDGYGGDAKPDWQTLFTVDCVLYWNRSTGSHATQKVVVTPARKVPMSEGLLICPAGTEVTENDRITEVRFVDDTVIEGLFIIDAVLNQETHVEVFIDRSHLGP